MIILENKETKEKVIVIDKFITKTGDRAFLLSNMENGFIYSMLIESIPDKYVFYGADNVRRFS